MITKAPLFLLLLPFIVAVLPHGSRVDAATTIIRSYDLHVDRVYLRLDRSVPPRLLQQDEGSGLCNDEVMPAGKFCYRGNAHPRILPVAAAAASKSSNAIMGPPIHVQVGDTLRVSVTNSMQNSGLSVHWHGFEMRGANRVYDGVVGVTQCAIPPRIDHRHYFDDDEEEGNDDSLPLIGGSNNFVYEFVVNEDPGTYWYHTHAGALDLVDAVKGPLIVHPRDDDGTEGVKELVAALNSGVVTSGESSNLTERVSSNTNLSLDPLSYRNERILFFSDQFTHPGHDMLKVSSHKLCTIVSQTKSSSHTNAKQKRQ